MNRIDSTSTAQVFTPWSPGAGRLKSAMTPSSYGRLTAGGDDAAGLGVSRGMSVDLVTLSAKAQAAASAGSGAEAGAAAVAAATTAAATAAAAARKGSSESGWVPTLTESALAAASAMPRLSLAISPSTARLAAGAPTVTKGEQKVLSHQDDVATGAVSVAALLNSR